MIKLIVLVIAVTAVYFLWLNPSPRSNDEGLSSTAPLRPQIVSSTTTESILHRRRIFCQMVEEVKKEKMANSSVFEKNSFDLSLPETKWTSIRKTMAERGCPPEEQLWSSLAVSSSADIEFGTLDGSSSCHVPESAGFTFPGIPIPPQL